MGYGEVIIKVQDRSTVIPSLPGMYGGIVLRTKKGKVNHPVLITSEDELIDTFGEPIVKYPEIYSALTFLSESNKLWAVRAAADDIKYSAALVRGKIKPVDTSNPLAQFDDESLIVKPLKGLTEEDLESYVFPTYIGNRLYEYENINIAYDSTGNKIPVDNFGDLAVNDKISLIKTTDPNGTLTQLNDDTTTYGESQALYTVTDLVTENNTYEKITLADAVTVSRGDEILKKDSSGNYVSYPTPVIVAFNASNSTEVIVYNADYMEPGDSVQAGGTDTTFNKKDTITIKENFVEIDKDVTYGPDYKIFKMTQSEYEERDSFLVIEESPGAWGNKISIGIAPSKNYENAFNILVYYDGVLVETWEVTKEDFVDGYGNQMYLEDKINGKSKYIRVIDNKGYDANPLYTDHSYWQRLKEPVYRSTGLTLAENLLQGNTQVYLSGVTGLNVGDRIKFAYDVDAEGNVILSKEYKVQSINTTNNYIIIDRPLEEYEIPKTYTDLNGNSVNTEVRKFDSTYNDSTAGILNGYQYYPIVELDKVFYNYPLGKIITIGDYQGVLLDAGVNLLGGGDNGSEPSLADMIEALDTLKNRDNTPIQLLMDGGYTNPAYAQELYEVAKAQDLCHVYLSVDPNAEMSADYKNAVVDYINKLNLDTEKASVYVSWLKVFDKYNKKYVWVAPSAFAAASQSYTFRNYYVWYPAAGLARGKVVALDSHIKPDQGTIDWFIENRINSIKYIKGTGFVIWGNRTLYSKPSPLQSRNVAMLLIYIKYGLYNMLPYKLFDLNTDFVWEVTQKAIEDFLKDIQAKNGLYDFKVAIKDIITDVDIQNRRMPIYIGIIPVEGIEEIPVTLAVYAYGNEIQVAL